MEFLVLGRLEVRREGRPIRIGAGKQRALLAFLLLHANQSVSRDRLIDELWGAAAPPTVSTQLRVRLAELRQLLEPGRESRAPGDVIVSQDGGYLIKVEEDDVDMLRFERLVGEASAQLDAGESEAASQELCAALALWRGSALEDFTYEPFAQATIARLEELRLVALERRIEADLALGRHEDLVPELEGLVATHRHRERLRTHLMLALYRAGRQGDALAAFQKTRHTLDEELGIEPSAALKELEQAILNQQSELALPGDGKPEPQARTELRNPYKGLRPFGPGDVADFFGRKALIDQLADRLEQGARFVCVLGASGSGKSSAVTAGLVPRLRNGEVANCEDVTVVEMMPGAEPLIELEAALLRVAHNPPASLIEQLEGHPNGLRRAVERVLPENGGDLVLVIDQFEELFTLAGDEQGRRQLACPSLCSTYVPEQLTELAVAKRPVVEVGAERHHDPDGVSGARSQRGECSPARARACFRSFQKIGRRIFSLERALSSAPMAGHWSPSARSRCVAGACRVASYSVALLTRLLLLGETRRHRSEASRHFREGGSRSNSQVAS